LRFGIGLRRPRAPLSVFLRMPQSAHRRRLAPERDVRLGGSVRCWTKRQGWVLCRRSVRLRYGCFRHELDQRLSDVVGSGAADRRNAAKGRIVNASEPLFRCRPASGLKNSETILLVLNCPQNPNSQYPLPEQAEAIGQQKLSPALLRLPDMVCRPRPYSITILGALRPAPCSSAAFTFSAMSR
jgi:hypothetical protein